MIDAGVALKWVLPETDSAGALDLRERLVTVGAAAYVPDLFWAEAANVLWRLTRGAGAALEADEALEVLDTLRSAPLATVPVEPVAVRALEIACAAGITAYDAAYVAVAELCHARLWTADRRLVRGLAGTEWRDVAAVPPERPPP